MEEMVKDLLAFSRALDPGKELPMVGDAGRVYHVVLQNLKTVISETQAHVSCGPLPWVGLPEIHLLQIFQNIIGNALKYHGANPPKIRVSAISQEQDWLFAISDEGVGIAPEFHKRIFGIFKRLDNSGYASGTGIGLALCKRIVEHYGGKIWVEENAGKGVTFFFSIPAVVERNQHEPTRS